MCDGYHCKLHFLVEVEWFEGHKAYLREIAIESKSSLISLYRMWDYLKVKIQ